MSSSKRQFGVANAAPHSWCHQFGGGSSPQAELVQPLVLALLVLDVLAYHRLVAAALRGGDVQAALGRATSFTADPDDIDRQWRVWLATFAYPERD